MYATKGEKRCSLYKVLKGEGEVVELEIKGDCSESGREGFYIRIMNLWRKAMERENGRDCKEIVHTLCNRMHVQCTLSRSLLVSSGRLLSADVAGERSDTSAVRCHGRQKMALGGRGAVSPNPKAASQDRKCFPSVGPSHLGHARNEAGLPPLGEMPPWHSCSLQVQGCCARAGELTGG